MSDENKTVFKLDVEVKEFIEHVLEAKDSIKGLGAKENISELVEGLISVAPILAVAGTAAFAFKEAIDLTIEAEQIKKVNNQFEILAETAGISSRELKEGLEEAAKGLIDNDELLQTANKSIVKMGESAAKLPEIMDLARKATSVFGGDLKGNFDELTTAISNGNTRMLKHLGIVVDAEKAVKDYAKANGVAANELSEAGKRQAILNEVLKQGEDRFQGIDTDIQSTANILTSLKVIAKEVGETFALAFEKTMGPSVRNFLLQVQTLASYFKEKFTASVTEGFEQNQAEIKATEIELKKLKDKLQEIKEGKFFFGLLPETVEADIEKTTAKLDQLKKKRDELSEAEDARLAKKGSGEREEDNIINLDKHLKNQDHFNDEMAKLDREMVKQRELAVNDINNVEALSKTVQLNIEADHLRKIQALKNDDQLNDNQRRKLELQENELFQARIRNSEEQTTKLKLQLLDQYTKNSTNAFQAVGRSFEAMSAKARVQWADTGAAANRVSKSVETHGVAAFATMGQAITQTGNVGQAVADALKSVILNVIADEAMARGQMLLLASIWPPNPVGIAAGAGLLALGGALRTLAGGSATQVAGATGGGTGDTAVQGYGTQVQSSTGGGAGTGGIDPSSMRAGPQRTVSINVQGNYFDTDSSRRQMMEMIRQESDATAFEYNQIGVR